MNRSQNQGTLLILLSAAGYAFLPIFAKSIYRNTSIEALDIMIWRFMIATPIIWIAVRLRSGGGARPRLPRCYLLGLGIIFGIAATTSFAALARVPASIFVVLFYTYPAMVALASVALGETLSLRAWLALCLTLLGVFLIVPIFGANFQALSAMGVLLTVVNAMSYAAYILLSEKVLQGHTAPVDASAWSITGSLLLAVVWIAARGVQVPDSAAAWTSILGISVLSTVLPILLLYAGIQRLGSARVAIISSVEPVLTLVLAVILLNETLSVTQAIGGVLVFSSVILLQKQRA